MRCSGGSDGVADILMLATCVGPKWTSSSSSSSSSSLELSWVESLLLPVPATHTTPRLIVDPVLSTVCFAQCASGVAFFRLRWAESDAVAALPESFGYELELDELELELELDEGLAGDDNEGRMVAKKRRGGKRSGRGVGFGFGFDFGAWGGALLLPSPSSAAAVSGAAVGVDSSIGHAMYVRTAEGRGPAGNGEVAVVVAVDIGAETSPIE